MKYGSSFLISMLLCTLSACSPVATKSVNAPPVLTKAVFQQLNTGMSYGEVVVILGRDGTVISSISEHGVKSVLYKWQGEGFKQITALFRDGKLANKYEVELQ